MTISYKNFWSLNTDEVIVTGHLRDYFKEAEVFMPLNAQLKDVDLLISNFKKRKLVTIQVKGSRGYEPKKSQTKKYGEGSWGWFMGLKENRIKNCAADFFIFLIYAIINENGRQIFEPHMIIIKPKILYKLCKNFKVLHKNGNSLGYDFDFWIDPKKKVCVERRERQNKAINFSEYLDEKGLLQIAKMLD